MSSFASDRRSGSGAVASRWLDELERWIATDSSRSALELRLRLLTWVRAGQAAQPSMALVHRLAERALEIAGAAVARADDAVETRRLLLASCAAERTDLHASREAVAATAARLIAQRGLWIATLSNSGLVRDALVRSQRLGMEPRALIAESRPLQEGRDLAAELAAAKIPSWLVVDAALPLLLSQAQMLWIGADAVTDRGAIGKIGSFAAALAAREHSVPAYALAEGRKFMPASTRALRIAEMPAEEVWDRPPAGVQARNVYFELVPLELLRGVVVENEVWASSEAATAARDRPLLDEIAAG